MVGANPQSQASDSTKGSKGLLWPHRKGRPTRPSVRVGGSLLGPLPSHQAPSQVTVVSVTTTRATRFHNHPPLGCSRHLIAQEGSSKCHNDFKKLLLPVRKVCSRAGRPGQKPSGSLVRAQFRLLHCLETLNI